MGLIRRFKDLLVRRTGEGKTDESGIALFMVVASITVLSVIVTEFTYVAHVNSRATADSSDQIKAHYLAKTGFKLSLLRLRAYRELKSFGGEGSNLPKVPKNILDQIWSFPFFYPIPAGAPGLTVVMKDEIEKFQDESSLPGKFTATIESESNKIGINSLIAAMAPAPAPSPSSRPNSRKRDEERTRRDDETDAKKKKTAKYDVEEARKGFRELLARIFDEKFKKDPDFANEYRDLEIDELYDNILGWIDFTYQPKNASGRQTIPYKRAPLYSLTELHMIHPVDDGIYNVLAENFTTLITPGINVNKIQEPMLRAILPGITDDEVIEFYKFRDSVEEDNTFKSADEFYKYIEKNVATYRSSTSLDELKTSLQKQGIQLLVDEQIFKITVVAEVNKATRILEAWVTLEDPKNKKKTAAGGPAEDSGSVSDGGFDSSDVGTGTAPAAANAAGLRLLYMKES